MNSTEGKADGGQAFGVLHHVIVLGMSEKNNTRCMQNKIIDRIAWNALNVFYDIFIISKIDFMELFKNNNYGFHDYIS